MSVANRPMRRGHVAQHGGNLGGSLIALALLLTGFGCGARPEASREAQLTNQTPGATSAERSQRVRAPAVAGLFYPREARALRAAVRHCLQARPVPAPIPKAIIAPHAGYEYSGPVAGSGYALLASARGLVTRVVLVGPSHYVALRGLALSSASCPPRSRSTRASSC